MQNNFGFFKSEDRCILMGYLEFRLLLFYSETPRNTLYNTL